MNRWSWPVAGRNRSRNLCMLAVAGLGLGLGGCVENAAELSASTVARTHMAARPGVSPRGAPVAIASIEGAPSAIAQKFVERTQSEAAGLDVVVTDLRTAKYLVRGYLSADPAAQGAVVSYVWDVFDSRRSRVQRVEDAVVVKAAGADPWAGVDDKALGELALKSAADLAAVLSNMPEAIAASRSAPAPVAAPNVATVPAPARIVSASSALQ